MRRSRSIRNRVKRRKLPLIDLDITSLLDILVIMLVFLLKSYNSSSVIINVPKSIKLPNSVSQSMSTNGVIIQMSSSKIWVDDKEVVDKTKSRSHLYDHGGRRIIPLYNELVRKKLLITRSSKMSAQAKKFSGIVNLTVEKTLPYREIKRLLYTCAEAGFKTYKFVVLGNEF